MSFLGALWGGVKTLFGLGGSTTPGGKSIVQETAEIVDNYNPGEVTQHKMAIEDVKTGDESQEKARQYEPKTDGTDWFNRFIDGLNRLPRPMFAGWAFCELTGILATPPGLENLNPIILNIIWTIIGFYFGVRTISQDLPKAVAAWYQIRDMMRKGNS